MMDLTFNSIYRHCYSNGLDSISRPHLHFSIAQTWQTEVWPIKKAGRI